MAKGGGFPAIAVAGSLTVLFFFLICVGTSNATLCEDVIGWCFHYTTGETKGPSKHCCAALSKFKLSITDYSTLFDACMCYPASGGIEQVKDEFVKSLPKVCNAPLPFNISIYADCNKLPPPLPRTVKRSSLTRPVMFGFTSVSRGSVYV